MNNGPEKLIHRGHRVGTRDIEPHPHEALITNSASPSPNLTAPDCKTAPSHVIRNRAAGVDSKGEVRKPLTHNKDTPPLPSITEQENETKVPNKNDDV